ncbi:glycoside hydrolase family 5 protein [Amycolatopsis sp. cmx-11-51]|uniref:glycoside hydrolase family 5 protein n=1 Tax=unclassified Amycolatopsis TaxID=2618356 RepID=UPI0039E4C8B1
MRWDKFRLRMTAALAAGLLAPIATASTSTATETAAEPATRAAAALPPGSPAAVNGQLKVCGLQLCNSAGKPIQLRGMSTHGIQWYSQCVKTASLDALANDWKADVLRISMYIQEGGYETNPRKFTDMVHGYIEEATKRGLYALVDWHQLTPGDPNANLSRAKTFFTEIAQRHKDKTNVIYDIANEPNNVSWDRVRSYAEQMIPVIRAQDSDGVVLVGTHGWGSLGISDGRNETDILNNPVRATNFMYTFHFYAASHKAEYFNALTRAASKIPLFVTEFGTQTASGDGGNDFTNSQKYLDFLASKKISWTNWNFSDDNRSGAVFKPGTCSGSSFTGTAPLKPAGVWIRDRIRTADNFPTS